MAMALTDGCGGPLVATIESAATARARAGGSARVRGGWRRRQADHAANDGGRTASAMRLVGSAAIATGNTNTDARLSSASAVAAERFSYAKNAALPRYSAQTIAASPL